MQTVFAPTSDRTLLCLLTMGLPLLALVWLIAPSFFTVYMGPNWTEAGEVTRIIIPMLLLRLLSAPLGSVFSLVGHQKAEFRIQLFLTSGSAFAVATLVLLSASGEAIIAAYTTAARLAYIASIVLSRQLAWGTKGSSR